MDLSTNSAVADTSSKTTVEGEQPPPHVNTASKEDTPSTEGSKNEEPTQTREVKGASDSPVPKIKSEPVTPVKSAPAPNTPESDGGSFCECDSPADSTGEAANPQGMEQPKTSTGGGHDAPVPTTKSSTTPAAAPTAKPIPSENAPEKAGSGSQSTTEGAQSDQTTTAAPAEKLTKTSPIEQLKVTSPAEHQAQSSPSEQLTSTKPAEQLTGPSPVQEVPPPVAPTEQPPTPATTQATTVPTKDPPQEMHVEEPQPDTCSTPATTTPPVSTPSNDTASPVTAPEAVMTEESHAAPEAEPAPKADAASPDQVPKAPPVSGEAPVPIPEPVAVTAPTETPKETQLAAAPASVTDLPPVSAPPRVTVSSTPEEAKTPVPSSVPPPTPVTENTHSDSKPDPTPAPTPAPGEPSPVAAPKPIAAVQSSTEAVPVVVKDPEQPSDLSSATPQATIVEATPVSQPPKEPKTEITKASAIEGQPGVASAKDVKDKEQKPEEEAMEVDTADQTASGEKTVTQPEPQAPCKLPTDAPPSMDDDSLSMGANGDVRDTTKVTEVSMGMEDSLGVPVTGCSSEESSKDAPPQDFKPFSHYTEDGKLIDNEEEKSTGKKLPVSAGDVAAAAIAGAGDSMSMDDSFPGGREELSESVKSQSGSCQPTEVSQFQGQFMDFLKCNDNATQHSFGADGKPLTPSNEGEATVGSGVTANGEATTQSEVPTTPQTGKKRKRRTKAQMIADRAAAAAAAAANNDDASNASQADSQKGSRSARKRKQNEDETTKDGMSTDGSPAKDGTIGVAATFPPEKLFEYQWPQTDKNADWFFLQEHLSAFLGVKSFKRKYPTLERRPVSMPERNFLQESGVVSEMMCDLGLTALKSDQVYELMLRDFAEKYQQYAEVLHEREQIRRSEEKNRMAADMASVNKNNVVDVVKKAVRSAAEFNAQFMRERREERKAYFDMQTCEVHYPKSTIKVLPPALTKVGAYPVALIPGQFSEYYKKYTPQQMKYFPLNTCMYDPPRHLKTIYADPADKYESELDSQSASSQGEDDGSSSSGSSSGSGSDGDSDSSSDVDEKETPAPTPVPTPAPASNKKSTKTPRGKKAPVKDTATMCNICQGTSEKNKIGEAEELVKCAECGRHGHPSCLELTIEMIPNIKTYPWQCMECKTCVECMDPYDEDKMMFCDHCDRGYHTFCVGLRSIPTGRWECPSCRPEQAPPSKKRRRQPPQKLEQSA